MNASYLTRLFCLSLTCFFLIDLALSAVVRLALPGILAFAGQLRARNAARLLFTVRILPAAGSLLLLLALCVPSYLWLEPQAGTERLTLFCLLTAALSAGLWAISLERAAAVLLRSARYLRLYGAAPAGGTNPDFLVIESAAPVLALAGVLRPRLLVSRSVLEALSAEELEAALGHEKAHRNAWDNLKRLVLLLSPTALPRSQGFAILERHLARYTEWAADDDATGGNPQRSVSLADALLRVSRLRVDFQAAAAQPELLVSSLVADDCALSARVERLLNLPTPTEALPNRLTASIALGIGVSCFTALVVSLPATLGYVHALLERLLG
ncbi:MAG: M48 family metalloprotease [Acidobacteriaceae bacterium]